jgi:lysozyme family protein
MPTADEMRNLLMQAVNELTRRGMVSEDPAEQALIEREIAALNRRINRIDQMLLLDAAATVANSAESLAAVVRSARTGPFDRYVEDMGRLIDRMRVAQEQVFNEAFGSERAFPKTEDTAAAPQEQPRAPPAASPPPAPTGEAAAPAAPAPAAAREATTGAESSAATSRRRERRGAPPSARPPAAPAAPAPPEVVNSTRFSELRAEYDGAWKCCEVRSEKRAEIAAAVARARAGRGRYEEVAAHFNGMPWQFLAVIHGMECGFRFDRHLHNGDPLTARTVRVPPGRPPTGNPPFTWEESARDAMEHMGYDRVTDWSLEHLLYLLEKFNGFGYRRKRLRTPYLWSYSNLYEKGRYVADRVFDPEAVSKQCGAAVLLKELL